MTRSEIRNQVRLLTLVEGLHVSDTELDSLINDCASYLNGFYPFGSTIAVAAGPTATPSGLASGFHWLFVEWVASQIFKREEYFDVAEAHEESFNQGVRRLVKAETGGRNG